VRVLDLRSDCATLPTPAMRQAMAQAELGDDVFGEDPTINRLEQLAAERVGKEAALYIPSGTMGNLTALLTHCGRGNEVILGDLAHIFLSEAGGAAALGGIHPRTLPTQPDGSLRLEDIERAIRPENVHHPRTRLICLENTHSLRGGVVLTPQYTEAVSRLAHNHGLLLHLDGARIFNAAVALDIDVRELVGVADSVQFCLSKGLSAPVGSMLCGTEPFIYEARRWRKMLGGGMRQAGVLAAAGIVALESMVDRLTEDHRHARILAEGLAEIPGFAIDLASVQTNIIMWRVEEGLPAPEVIAGRLAERGVKVYPIGDGMLRAVTHSGISGSDIELALETIQDVVRQM